MPWKETNAMEQREMFIKAWLSRRYTKIELCQQFNISRPTADKWIKRHEQVGFEGLAELIGKMAYVVQHSDNGHASIKFAGLERQISGQMTSDDGDTDVHIYVIIPDIVAGVEPEVHHVQSAWDVPI